MIVHLGTHIKVTLGRLDAEGNVIRKEEVALELSELTEDGFRQAFRHVLKRREMLNAALTSQENKGEADA